MRKSNKHTNHTKGLNSPIILARAFWVALVASSVSGCTSQTFWDDSYNLRQWERAYLAAETFDLAKKYDQARVNYFDSLGYAEKLAPNSLRLTDTLARLGNSSAKLGDKQTAESSYQRAIGILRDALLKDASNANSTTEREHLAYNLSRLGALHEENHQFSLAEQELNESIAIYQQLEADDKHPKIDQLSRDDYAGTLASALYTAVDQNKTDEAKRIYALVSSPRLATAFAPSVMNDINRHYAAALDKAGQPQEARDVLAAGRCRAQCKLGFDCLKSGYLSSAEKHYLDALEIAKRMKSSFLLAITYAGLGDVYSFEGKLADAQSSYKSAVTNWIAMDSKPNHGTDALLESWAGAAAFEPMSVAEPILNQWLNSRIELYGAQDERTSQPLLLMAIVCDHQNQNAKAADFAERAFLICKDADGKERVDAYGTQAVGDLLFCQGQFGKAEQIYRHLIERNKFYRRSSGYNDAELTFRIAALQNCQGQSLQSHDTEATGMQIVKSFKRTMGSFFVAKSLAYLLSDLQRHSQREAVTATASYIRPLIAIAEPASLREQQSRQIALAAVDAAQKGTTPNLSRIVLRVQPGSLESFFTKLR